MRKLILSLFAIISLSACTTNHGTYTVISNQVADLDNIDLSTAKKVRNVEGSSVGHIVIFFPAGELNPNVESAMNDAFKNVDGDLFTNARVHSTFFWIPYIYGRNAMYIEGDVVKTRK